MKLRVTVWPSTANRPVSAPKIPENHCNSRPTPFAVGALVGVITRSTSVADVAPLLWLGMAIFVVAFLVISFVAIPEPHMIYSQRFGSGFFESHNTCDHLFRHIR